MKKKFWSRLAVATTALACIGSAQADKVITFDAPIDTTYAPFAPLLTHYDELQTQGFWVDTYSTKASATAGADLVGALIDGANLSDICASLVCPTNNSSVFLGILNDGFLDMYTVNGSVFKLKSFDASFIAASGDAVLSTSLVLRIDGYNNGAFVATQNFNLPGPNAGAYSFDTYSLNAGFAGTEINEMAIYGYACTTTISCTRGLDKAQFAIDNITVGTVPEPAEWLLMGLGLAAVGGLVRRRRAA